MKALMFLREYPSLIGEDSFWLFFSALKIAEHFNISIYKARLLVAELREMGLVKRYGNLYALTNDGQNFAYTLAEIKEGLITK